MISRLSHAAIGDIEQIWLYTFENWSKKQADRYVNHLFNEIDYLCANPESGISIDEIRSGYRKLKVNAHLIFYKIDVQNQEIHIIRVLHEMMDHVSHLG